MPGLLNSTGVCAMLGVGRGFGALAGWNYTVPLLVGALHLATASAYADVAPPPEEDCTRAKAEKDDEYCVLHSAAYDDPYGCLVQSLEELRNSPADPGACRSDSLPTDSDCCQVWLEAGWTYRCQTYEVYIRAMWCRPRQEGDPPRPVDYSPERDKETMDCSIGTAPSDGMSVTALLFALAGLGALNRRSRRSPYQ